MTPNIIKYLLLEDLVTWTNNTNITPAALTLLHTFQCKHLLTYKTLHTVTAHNYMCLHTTQQTLSTGLF